MFTITVTIGNPMANESRVLNFQFDPATMDAPKWASAFGTIRGKIDELLTSALTHEPTKW